MGSVEKMEEYVYFIEESFFSSLSAVSNRIPDMKEIMNRLWVDISRYGPGMPRMNIPILGDFQVPPPPPPPPLYFWGSLSFSWVRKHPWKSSSIAVGLVGATFLIGYGTLSASAQKRNAYRVKSRANERRQIVVVLGGESPFALPLVHDLEAKGYIVIVTVSNPEAVEAIQRRFKGYVKALVLDPYEIASIPVFMRSLTSTLSLKFPLTSSGDPFTSLSSHPYIHSIISLFTLSAPAPAIHAPLEHISLCDDYLPYLSATHIAPLQVIQLLMPLLRTSPAQSQDKGKKSIIVCLPAPDAHVGLPFASIQAMSAASTLRGVEVLRREIKLAALTDSSESMKNIKVVVIDVGSFDVEDISRVFDNDNIYQTMEGWSASEKLIYGPAFASSQYHHPAPTTRWEAFKSLMQNGPTCGVPRKPTDISDFVRNIVGVVDDERRDRYLKGISLGMRNFYNFFRPQRFSIGAGANTYRIASQLPSFVLDCLLNIPHFLIMVHNRLLMVQSLHQPSANFPTSSTPQGITNTTDVESQGIRQARDANSELETFFESGIESNASSDVGSSWVSLRKAQS